MARTLFPAAVAGAILALALPAAPALADPDTHSIPLSSLPQASVALGPQSGTLANGVGFSVNVGLWDFQAGIAQGYVFTVPTGPQVWTFDRPVSVRFGLAGLQFPGECLIVPAGTVLETLNAAHSYDSASRKLCRAGSNNGAAASTFTHPGPISDLALIAVGSAGEVDIQRRGPSFIDVTYETPNPVADTPTAVQDEPVTFDPAGNDAAGNGDLVPESVRLLDGGTPLTTLTNDDGTYTVNTSTGAVTFEPRPGFVGTAAPVQYRILDTFGVSGDSTITVTVGPIVGVSMFNGPVALGALGALGLAGGGFLVRRRMVGAS